MRITPSETIRRLQNEQSWVSADSLAVLRHLHASAAKKKGAGPWKRAEEELFGDPRKLIDSSEEHGPGIFASLMDGPLVDLVTYAGLNLTDDSSDKVSDVSWSELLERSGGDVLEVGDADEYPGMSDVFYWILIEDPIWLARSLRIAIVETIQAQAT